jgi:hypothetical protein
MIQVWSSLKKFARRIGGRVFGWEAPKEWVSVKSSFIGSLLWFEDARGKPFLAIYFYPRGRHSGRVYLYYGVTERQYRLLLSASSHGREFWRILRNPGHPGSSIQPKEITGTI